MLRTKLQARLRTKRLNTNKTPALIAACVVALSLSACGSSEALSDLDDALSGLGDAFDGVGDTPVNDDTPGQSADEASQEINNLLFGDEMQELSYKTLEELGPFQARLYGSDEIFVVTSGPNLGSGELANSSLALDIDFEIEGEVTEGLVIEKLYAVKSYPRFIGCDLNQTLCALDFSDASPRIYAVVTNLSNVDVCNVRFGDRMNAIMKQGGTVNVGRSLDALSSGHQYIERSNTFVFNGCITPGASIFAHSTFDSGRLSEFNNGDDFADIEDIESFSIEELLGSPQTRRANGILEPGFVTTSYESNGPDFFGSQFSAITVNQSSERLDERGGVAFVLDPDTLLPLSHFGLTSVQNRDDDRGDYNPGDELRGPFGSLSEGINVFPGSSTAVFFRNRYALADE